MYHPEDRYRLLVDHLPDGFAYQRIVLDAGGLPVDYVFLEVNPAFERLTGLSREQLIGKRATTVLTGVACSLLGQVAAFGRVALAGESTRVEQYSEPAGRWYEVFAYSDETGYFATVYHDVTERALAGEAQRTSEQRFRLLFEQSLDAIYVVAPDGATIDANHAWLELFGYSREDIASFNAVSLYADPADRLDFLQRMEGKAFLRDEVRFKRKDGSVFDCERTVVPLRDSDGNLIAYQGVHRDVTARKTSERLLREANAELRELAARLDAAREEERAAVAWELHDEVAQTLSVLKMDIAICRRRLSAGLQQTLGQRLDEMTQLLDDTIVRLRRLYSDLVPVMLEDLGLAAAIEWQVEGFGRRAGVRSTVCHVDDVALPQARMALGLFRVLQEALENVLTHSGATRVTVDLERCGGIVVLRVADDGREAPGQSLAGPGGTGLAGIRARVRSWGGEVDVDSSDTGGTVLKVTVPLA